MQTKKLRLTFAGGTGWVTGANFLLETIPDSPEVESYKILVDCGMIQGGSVAELDNWDPFPYDPKKIDVLIISHSHQDHIGRIPKLVYEGFNGRIIATAATADLANVMLEDTAKILSSSRDAIKFNLKKIYSPEILAKISRMWETYEYHENFTLNNNNFQLRFKDAGHILGSVMTEITYNNSKIVFSGDLGNSPSPLLNDTEDIAGAKYLVMESVYGDRNHEERTEREELFKKVIIETHNKNGVLLVPIFSLERTQEFLFQLNNFIELKQVPKIKVYLDSPLAIRVTDVFRKHLNYFKETVRVQINQGDNIFDFPGLKETPLAKDSIKILKSAPPKIILAGSGMSTGGRILHHEKNYLSDPNTTLLITGYQVAGTLGRLLQEGRREIMLFNERVKVKAKIASIQGYSGHKDSYHLVKFVGTAKDTLKKVFVVMGEPHSSMFLAQKIRDNHGVEAIAPELYDVVELDF